MSGAEIIDKVREIRVGTEAIEDTVLKQNVNVYNLVGSNPTHRRYTVLKMPKSLTFGPAHGHFLSQGTVHSENNMMCRGYASDNCFCSAQFVPQKLKYRREVKDKIPAKKKCKLKPFL